MSLIIEDEIFLFKKPDKSKITTSIHENQPILKKFMYQNELNTRCFQIIGMHGFVKGKKSCLKFIIPLRKRFFNSFDIWYSANLDQNSICSEQKIILAKNDTPLKVEPYKKKLEALRQICRYKQGEPKFVKIYISNEGIISCILPKIVLTQNIANSFRVGLKNAIKGQAFSMYVENITKFVQFDIKLTLKNIFDTLTYQIIEEDNPKKQLEKEAQEKTIKFDLFRYLARSPIELRFDCTEGSALYQQVVDITLTEQKQIQERISHMKQANLFQLTSLKFYMQSRGIFEGKEKQAFFMTAKEKQLTKNLLQIPQVTPIKQNIGQNHLILENKYMFNNICLELPQQIQTLVFLGESGFGRIQFGTFNFWYLMNSKLQKNEMEQNLKQSNKIKSKYLVVKSPKFCNDAQSVKKYESKQTHQIRIINRLKGISCALIPRFYKVERFYPEPFNSIHQEYIKKYQNALLSELTSCYGYPGYNVGNLIEDRWKTLTLKKIIYIMSQVAQVLRFLHLNKIVHLDLKPENILFLKNFAIKIIDFGESFHPLVPYQGKIVIQLRQYFHSKIDSVPAYTYPYGCPQIAQNNQSFSDKSDVFSFGIILYELIYGKDLITTSPYKLLKNYKDKSYSKRVFINYQELESYGQKLVLPMLNHLIIKTLSSEVESRSSITWISVLLKNFLQILP